MSTSEPAIRAKRFSVHLPLQYRLTGTSEWQRAEAENISCSGVLFRSRRILRPFASIEVMLQLPPELSGEALLSVVCGAYVARVESGKSPLGPPAVAAAFVTFRLMSESGPTQPRLHAEHVQRVVRPNAVLAHGLNNALAVILGNCELLLGRADLENGVRKSLLRIREAAQLAGNLAREL